MTTDNVVTRAIAELKQYVVLGTGATDQLEMELRNHTNDKMLKLDVEFSRYQLRLAKTHLAEFEEHKKNCNAEFTYCVACRLKAKRLMGE